jgi:hypothetical protein
VTINLTVPLGYEFMNGVFSLYGWNPGEAGADNVIATFENLPSAVDWMYENVVYCTGSSVFVVRGECSHKISGDELRVREMKLKFKSFN